jgi:GrpB-like predicted nucleotidyltransferase (UPF0157 family)
MSEFIVIAPYDPEWPEWFSQVGSALRAALGPVALRIDHIGSTSVVGLDAKPVLDIQISVTDLELLEAFRVPLQSLGYVFQAENPERTKRYFRESPGERRTHIHVRRAGSFSEQFALLFRDYLRAHPDDARSYAALKHRLAARFGEDRQGYVDAKDSFIWETIKKADGWAQEIGWQPGFTDC